MRKLTLFFLIPSFGMAAPVINPSTATVYVGNTVQFASTDTVSWSMAPGSVGSISVGGLYTAPSSIQARNSIAGCPVVPNDHIYNVNITSLPVDANSAGRLGNIGAGIAINFEVSFPLNVMTNTTPTDTMKFYYTTSSDGRSFPILATPYRGVETNLYPNDYFAQDRHQLGVNTDTCQFTEIYNYYPLGTNIPQSCPTCNAQSGVQWGPMSYQLANSDGSTDAAGLYIQPLAIRYDELKAGAINHALRFTLSNGYNYSGFLWPGTNFAANCSDLATCVPYGSRFRLKSSFDTSSFSPTAKVVLNAMKSYGMFMADGGISFHIQVMSDVLADTTTWTALMSEIPGSALDSGDFEQVDESSLMVSSATGRVKIPNTYNVAPSNYAVVVATKTSDNTTSYVYVAVQPVKAGTKNIPFPPNSGTLSVMSGTPQFQIPYWVNGATTTTVTCTMSPTVGSLTSDCLYTAPTSGVRLASTTIVTVTPTADSTGTITFPLTVFPSDGIRIDAGGKAGTITSPVIPYDSLDNYGPDSGGKYWAADPPGNIPPWYAHDDNSYPQPSWPGTTDVGLWYTDVHATSDGAYAAMVPNGNYTLKMLFAWNTDPSIFLQSIDSQGSIIVSSAAFASAIGSTPYATTSISRSVQVTNNQFYFALRYSDTSKFSLINAWSLIYDSAISSPGTFSGNCQFNGKTTIK